MGGGDYYTSHNFKNLRWMDFVDHILQESHISDGEQYSQDNIHTLNESTDSSDQHCVLSINHGRQNTWTD